MLKDEPYSFTVLPKPVYPEQYDFASIMLEPVDFFFCLYCFTNGISSICSQDFLRQYYNLVNDHLVRKKRSEPSFISKVKEMQMFFGLNSTGVLDSETLQVMQSPRCGVPDVEEYSHIQGTRWNKNVLTYRYCVWLRLILLFFLSCQKINQSVFSK